MAIPPLAQVLTIAVLAYMSGLLLGLAFHRGEIGPRRAPPASAAPQHPAVPAERRASGSAGRHGRGHLMRKLRRNMTEISLQSRRLVTLALLLLVLTGAAIGVMAMVLNTSAQPKFYVH